MTALAGIFAFLTSRVGVYIMIGLVAGGVALGLRQQGYNAASRKCEAAAKQREIEIKDRDVKIGELLAKEDQRNQTEQDKDREKDAEFQRKLEEELAKRPAAARCLLTEPDRLRLR